MAPVHDTDLSEKRWEHEEWRRFELWERIELRIRRNRRLVYVLAGIVFLALSSVPIWMDRGPRYRAVEGARELAGVLNRLKLEVAHSRQSMRLVLAPGPGLEWRMEKVSGGCGDAASASVEPFRTGRLLAEENRGASFQFLSEEEGVALGVPGLGLEFCYDPIAGSHPAATGRGVAGFGILPAGDLTAGRADRVATVVVRGAEAEPRFE